ncbi:putative MACPF domain-containing protein CAD1/NSL1 [Helianthus debilis subsp. tardiflorus]
MVVGSQDLIFVKQKPSSTISSVELRGYLDDLGDNMYSGGNNPSLLDRKPRNGKQKVPDVFTRMLRPHTKQFTNITETSSKTEIAFTVMENGAATYALITNLNITETPS